MRLNINLASQPYENVRRFALRWGSILAALALISAGLVYFAYASWRDSKDVNQQIAAIQAEIRSLDREKQEGLALLNQPRNRATADQSKFLNQLIARKAFSFTTVFMDLERLMPLGLHVVSVKPELDKENQLQVMMVVGGSSRDRAIELVRRMEQSPTFRQARVRTETVQSSDTGTGDPIQFEITSTYVPQNVVPSESKASGSDTTEKNKAAAPSDAGGSR